MIASRCERVGGAIGHLLLVVVLALGIFVMHTVGHPDGSAGRPMAHSSPATGVHTDGMSDPRTPGAEPAASAQLSADPISPGAYTSAPVSGMDMAALCVAVLCSLMLLALLRAALARRPEWMARTVADAVVMLRPNPPPRGPSLSALSVLRI
ncbi:hypothetical protein OG304_04650 [Streptomyces sp. NBC_00160]|uniref:hypothetical protein n=1 Tax=Streptomyces sp. NBC_00160 TaxID=2903628 RepID=UPI002256BE7C|nr:hypothetical protein [Streptomyces sp. NBC_00160]MCX5302742.1 hypothetical protein [Streptomyces sp. NBC_00160]